MGKHYGSFLRSTTEIRVDLAKKIKEMKEILPLKAIAGKKNINIE